MELKKLSFAGLVLLAVATLPWLVRRELRRPARLELTHIELAPVGLGGEVWAEVDGRKVNLGAIQAPPGALATFTFVCHECRSPLNYRQVSIYDGRDPDSVAPITFALRFAAHDGTVVRVAQPAQGWRVLRVPDLE